jgi:hypothetical protein
MLELRETGEGAKAAEKNRRRCDSFVDNRRRLKGPEEVSIVEFGVWSCMRRVIGGDRAKAKNNVVIGTVRCKTEGKACESDRVL